MILGVIDLDDQGSLKIRNYKNSLDDLDNTQKKVTSSGGDMKSSLDKTGNSFDDLTARSGELIESLITLTGAGVLGELLKDSAELAARTQTLGVVMGVVSSNAKASSFEYATQAELVKRLGITTQEAAESVIKFAQANLNVADTAKIARVAQDLAVVAGINSSEAFGILTQAIESNHVLMLRQFGIVTSLTAIYQEYATKVGKSADALDEQEKKQAFVNKILEEGAKVSGSYEQAMTTAGKQMTSFARFAEDAKVALGEALLPTMYLIVVGANDLLGAFANLEQGHRALIAAILTGIAVMALLTGTMKGLVALGVVSFFQEGAAAVSLFVEAFLAGNLAQLPALFSMILSPVGLLVIAIGVLTAAYVLFTSKTEINTQALVTEAAQHQANIKSLTDLQAKTDAAAKAGSGYNDIAVALVKIAPEQAAALSKTGTSYNDVRDAINGAIGAQKEHIALVLQTMGIAKGDLQATLDKQQAAYQDTARQMNNLNDAVKSGDLSQEEATRAMRGLGGQLADNAKAITETTGKLKSLTTQMDAMRESTDSNYHSQQEGLRASALFTEELGKLGGSMGKVHDLMNEAKLTNDQLQKAFADPTAMKVFIQKLDDASAAHDKLATKNKKLEDQLEQTYEEVSGKDVAAFDVLNEHLNKVAFGSDQYFALLDGPGKSALSLFQSGLERGATGALGLSAAVKDNLLAAIEAVQAKKFSEEFDKWSVAANKSAIDINTQLTLGLQKLKDSMSKSLDEASLSFQQQETNLAAAIDKTDADLILRTTAAKKSEVDQKIAQNDRYYQNLIDSNNKQIQAIQATIDKEMLKYEELRKGRIDDINNTINAAELKMREDDAVTTNALQNIAILHPALKAEIESEVAQVYALQAARGAVLDKDRTDQIAATNEAVDAAEKEYTARSQGLTAYATSLSEQNSRIRSANALTNTQILQQNSVLWKTMTEFPDQFMKTVEADFIGIINGQKTFRDLFLDIWKSIETELFNIFDRIVKKWTDSVVANLIAGSGGGSSFGGGGAGDQGPTQSMLGAGTSPLARFGGGGLMAIGGATELIQAQNAGQSLMGGALTGAGIGTMIAPGIGTAVGAGVGLVVGGVSALLGAGGPSQDEKDARATIDTFQGQLAQLATAQQKLEAGGERWKTTLITVRDAYASLGLSSDQAQTDVATLWGASKKGADATAAAIKTIQDNLDLVKARQDLIDKAGSMEKLRKEAQLVGVDVDKMFDVKNVDDFNSQVDQLNKLLDESQKRLTGLTAMAAGLGERVGGFESLLDKTVGAAGDASGLDATQVNDILVAYQKVHDKTLQDFAGSTGNGDFAAALKKSLPDLQASFDRLGQDAVFQFASIVKETGDINQAMKAVGPTLVQLTKLQGEFGFTSNTALTHLLEFQKVIAINDDVASTVSGITAELKAMTENGIKSQDMFTSFGDEAANQWDILQQRGVAADQALMLMQPTLQALYEAQKNFGYQTDDSTQSLINMGLQQGIIGDQMQDVNHKILDVLVLIGDALGADIPDAYKDVTEAQKIQKDKAIQAAQDQQVALNTTASSVSGITDQMKINAAYASNQWQNDVINAAQNVEDTINGVALGHSPGGVKEITYQLRLAQQAMKAFHADATSSMSGSERSVNSYAASIKALPQNVGRTPQGAGLASQIADALSVAFTDDNGKPLEITLDGDRVATAVIKRQPKIVRLRGVQL